MIYLGIADIMSAGLLGLNMLGVHLPAFLLIIFSAYLGIKLLVFGVNLAGVVDLVAAAAMMLSIFVFLPENFYSVVSAALGLKGAQSILITFI